MVQSAAKSEDLKKIPAFFSAYSASKQPFLQNAPRESPLRKRWDGSGAKFSPVF